MENHLRNRGYLLLRKSLLSRKWIEWLSVLFSLHVKWESRAESEFFNVRPFWCNVWSFSKWTDIVLGQLRILIISPNVHIRTPCLYPPTHTECVHTDTHIHVCTFNFSTVLPTLTHTESVCTCTDTHIQSSHIYTQSHNPPSSQWSTVHTQVVHTTLAKKPM